MAIMTAEEAAEAAKGLTFEKVWAALMETRQNIDRMSAENAARSKKLDKQIDKMTKNLGGLNRSMGELIETLIAARLWEKFSAYPYNLKRAYQRVPIYDENSQVLTDIDILLADGEWVMAMEVKREATKTSDVDRHLKRMDLIRKHPPLLVTGQKLLGALSGGVVDADVREYAHSAGFFVLELKGEAVRLVPPPEGFNPRVW